MAWVISWFAILLATVGVQVTTCTMGDDGSWLVSLFFYTPIAFCVLLAIWLTRRHHSKWIWLAAPLVIVIPYCVYFTLPYLWQNTIHGTHMCAILDNHSDSYGYDPDPILRLWAPTQLLLLGAYITVMVGCWRMGSRTGGAT